MYKELKNNLRAKFRCLYIYLCLCGNKDKYEKQVKIREIEDENEELKELYEGALNKIKNLVDDGKLKLSKNNIGKLYKFIIFQI